jgi:hypothetical protein
MPINNVTHWWTLLLACAVGIGATCRRYMESEETRILRLQRKREKELRRLAGKISSYARKVHQRYPTGDVVVSESDLAAQLRKPPDTVARALDLLWAEKKVQRSPLDNYWKLNV